MTTPTFTLGQEVYDIHGRAGAYVARASNGHVVEPIYDGEFEPSRADAETWREVFSTPPVERLHVDVAAIEKTLSAARAELEAVREERRVFDREERERLARLKKYVHLSRIDDYLEGRITHFVAWERHTNAISIVPFEQFMKNDGRHRLPLLVLYGNNYDDREMLSTEWCRISDDNTLKVMPCASLEEAQQKAQIQFDRIVAEWRTKPSTAYSLSSAVEGALRCGLIVPDDARDEANKRLRMVAEQNLERSLANLAHSQRDFDAATVKLAGAKL